MGVRVKDPSTGQFKEIYVKALDSLPVGTIVDYDGQASDIPTGWETYGTNQIKKTSETRPLASHTVNAYSESESNAYSCDYVNNKSIETIYNNDETFAFNGNAYASKNITLPKNISGYKMLLINVGEPYGNATYYEQMLIPADLLISGNIFRKFIFLAAIQSYMQIKYNSDNSIEIWLEHTSAIGGSKTIKVNIVSLNNYQAEQTQQSTRSLNTYSGDIEEKKDIVIDGGNK